MSTDSANSRRVGFTVTVPEAYDLLNRTANIALDKNAEEENDIKREHVAGIIGNMFDNLDVISLQSELFSGATSETPRISVGELVSPIDDEIRSIKKESLETHTESELGRILDDNDRLSSLYAVSGHLACAYVEMAYEQQRSANKS